VEGLKYYGFGLGLPQPWAQYTPRLVPPPPGSELIEEWQFFQGLAARMGIDLRIMSSFRSGSYVESPSDFVAIDHADPPTTEQIFAGMTRTARVPLEEVMRHPNGRLFAEIDDRVQPREPGDTARLQLGSAYVMDELRAIRAEDYAALRRDGEFPFLLVSRRANNTLNSIGRSLPSLTRGRGYNPLYVHPDDLASLGLRDGDGILVRSLRDAIPAIVEADDTLRRGVVAMNQGFGGHPDEDHRYREIGSSTNRLIAADEEFDSVTGIPRMGAIPVSLAPAEV
jgi:anaerobic selenocysteine-containing dehydrogenase